MRGPGRRAAEGQAGADVEIVAARPGQAHGRGRARLVQPPIWYDPAVEDSELVPLDDADWAADLSAWQAECEQSRANAAGKDLSFTGIRRGVVVDLRWIYVHMIEEYARHNGHADLIRELLDGAVGW